MKIKFAILMCLLSTQLLALSPWIDKLNTPNKQEQLDLRWKASGGQADLKLMYEKLDNMEIKVFPAPEFPDKHWDYNHLVYPISENSKLELQMPYGNIEKVTSGTLNINSNFSLSFGMHTVHVKSFTLIPLDTPKNSGDIVNFRLYDQDNNHLFNISSIHIEYDKEKKLLLMHNMDLFASEKLAQLLHYPHLENQVIGQLHTFNKLEIPENAQTFESLVEGDPKTCAMHPIWPNQGGDADVALTAMNSISWLRNIGDDKIVIAPSATLKNVGTADVPWQRQFSGDLEPYGTDQHPFLNWSMYREIDNRFEQLAVSGVKHAFLTINVNCTVDCNDGQILWLGCEDVYAVGNNDSSFAIGPREEIEADKGIWENCGSFFDPKPCSGDHRFSSNGTDENRLVVYNEDLLDSENMGLYFQAWYLIRDDINIFNSMGYRPVSPVDNGNSWSMGAGTFSQGAALDNYVDPQNIQENEATDTVESGEGQFAVAVKVIELEDGMYRYNYAVENYEYDPRFVSYHLGLDSNAMMNDMVFSDLDRDIENDWQFDHSNGSLNLVGDNTNDQDWGMLFSFSFTTDRPPVSGTFSIESSNPGINQILSATVLVPFVEKVDDEIIFISGFE